MKRAVANAEFSRQIDSLPRVVISLDFELRWGVHHHYGLDFNAYRQNLEAVRRVVPALLKLFAGHRIRTTWAAVGALACKNWDEYFSRAPQPPRYKSAALAFKRAYADLDPHGLLHFAPDVLREILASPGQELGTHTFSHLYLREEGITADDVASDLAAVSELYQERFGIVPRSLVFPRNQPAFLDVVRASTIRISRGNPGPWYYECEDSRHNGPLSRTLKLMDSINPLCRLAAPLVDDMTRASLFLRLNLPRVLWAAHVQRIKGELVSLSPQSIFHIWFHPHNLGQDTELRLSRVEQVVELIAERQARGELVSSSMGDLVQ